MTAMQAFKSFADIGILDNGDIVLRLRGVKRLIHDEFAPFDWDEEIWNSFLFLSSHIYYCFTQKQVELIERVLNNILDDESAIEMENTLSDIVLGIEPQFLNTKSDNRLIVEIEIA